MLYVTDYMMDVERNFRFHTLDAARAKGVQIMFSGEFSSFEITVHDSNGNMIGEISISDGKEDFAVWHPQDSKMGYRINPDGSLTSTGIKRY